MDMPERIHQAVLDLLLAIGILELRILVNGAGDHIEVKLLGLARAVIHVERE